MTEAVARRVVGMRIVGSVVSIWRRTVAVTVTAIVVVPVATAVAALVLWHSIVRHAAAIDVVIVSVVWRTEVRWCFRSTSLSILGPCRLEERLLVAECHRARVHITLPRTLTVPVALVRVL